MKGKETLGYGRIESHQTAVNHMMTLFDPRKDVENKEIFLILSGTDYSI
jgi:hypothetical protein